MKTIKLPYSATEDFSLLLRQYSNVVRYSYNRLIENKSEKDIRLLTKSLKNVDQLNSWLVQCGIKDAKAIQTRFKDEKVVFGGKPNFIKRSKNKLSKADYRLKRLIPINIQGEELQRGNRLFNLDIIENSQIIFKLNKSKHIELKLPRLRKNIQEELFKLQKLNEVKTGHKGYTYSVRLTQDNIYISFEEFKEKQAYLNKNRYMGIDLNPDTVGVSVLNDGHVAHAQEFSLKPIFEKILKSELSSDSPRMKYFQNKLKFETFQVAKSIASLASKFNCQTVFIEDLGFKDHSGIKISNRKNKNLWKRELLVNNLGKRLGVLGIGLNEVNPAYSSFIGNLQHGYSDAVNASIEIARRGFEYKIKKNKTGFYPSLLVKHQWKEMATKFSDWKKFYLEIKNLKLKYRVPLDDASHPFSGFKQNSSYKSMVLNYVFYK